MNIIPTGSRILVKRSKSDETTPGGLHIPDNAKTKQAKGTVMAVGPGKTLESGLNEDAPVYTGQTVLFGKYSGINIESDEELVMLSFDDIIGIIK